MNVGLATFEVVVQVVPEEVDQVDGVVPGLRGGVSGEQDEGDITDPVSSPGVGVFQSKRRLPDMVGLSERLGADQEVTYLLLNNTVGAVALAFLPSRNSRMNTSLRMMSLASLKMVEKMTVTLSALASTYMVSSSR